MRYRSLLISVVVLGQAVLLAGCPPEPAYPRGDRDELKVTKVVLYQNGIGYFERRGRVDSDVVKLRIRPEQIADILKSLTVVDLADGRAVSVALPVEKSRARALADLPEQVRRSGGLVAIATAFRGARAEVETGEGPVAGRIVGVEQLSGDGDKAEWRLTLMVGAALKSFRMNEVSGLRILDRTLEVGLSKALDVALDEGAWKPVELAVHLTGKRPHDLLVSYVVEMPTWKPAYRIVLDKEGKALLQGWAVVDNVSGEDWKGVSMSLTAGTPLTFTYDLYTPRFVARRDLSPRGDEIALAPPPPPPPVSAAEALKDAEEDKPAMQERSHAGSGRGPRGAKARLATRAPMPQASRRTGWARPRSEAAPAAPAPARDNGVSTATLERNFRALVQGAKVGALFRYDLEEKVYVPDRQSALVSILNARVKAEDVLLYNVERGGTAPYRAVRFTNQTPYVMEKGPIAIYRDGTFVGEALTDRVDPGMSAFIPYSLDPRIHVAIDDSYRESGVSLVTIVRGHVTVELKSRATHSYVVGNQAPEAATLWVQRTRRPGWHLVAPKAGVLDERGVYFVPLALQPKSKRKVAIEEETPSRRVVRIYSDAARKAITLFLGGPDAAKDPKLAAALRDVLKLQERLGRIEEELRRLREEKEGYGEREEQVRENLRTLGKSARNEDLRRKLLATLTDLENKLNDVNRKTVTRNVERSELRDRLAVLIQGITLGPAR
jgi:hypothetical protein